MVGSRRVSERGVGLGGWVFSREGWVRLLSLFRFAHFHDSDSFGRCQKQTQKIPSHPQTRHGDGERRRSGRREPEMRLDESSLCSRGTHTSPHAANSPLSLPKKPKDGKK
jgi:hypothetical protein